MEPLWASKNSIGNISTNFSLYCMTPHYFPSSQDFFACYRTLFVLKWDLHVFELLLSFFTVVFNILVIFILLTKPIKCSIFDKILICHCIVDGMIGGVDAPFFHFTSVFGYWPLGNVPALLWSIFDSGINAITNMHMVYMTWVRLRSIRAPFAFKEEILIRHYRIVIIAIWLGGLGFWAIIAVSFGLRDFSTIINIKPIILKVVFIFLLWFLPLLIVIVLGFVMIFILYQRDKKRRNFANVHKNRTPNIATIIANGSTSHPKIKQTRSILHLFKYIKGRLQLDAQAKFQIIIITYWIQWLPSYIIAIINPLCTCIPDNVIEN